MDLNLISVRNILNTNRQTQSSLIIHAGAFVLASTLKRKECNACQSVKLEAFKTEKPVLFLVQVEHNE